MITLQQLNVTIENHPILNDVSFAFDHHDFICLIGSNGSGKTTLLKAMSGLLPYHGSICIDGQESGCMNKQVRAKKIAYFPQHKNIPQMRVIDLIAHGRYPHLSFAKVMLPNDKEKVLQAAKTAQVEPLLERDLDTLSGGERQRAYIAMMIAQDADILLLDEPTTYLDIQHQIEVFSLLQNLHALGKGIVMVVHDLPQAFTYAKRIIVMENGSIVKMGTPQQLYQDTSIYRNFKVHLQAVTNQGSLYAYQLSE